MFGTSHILYIVLSLAAVTAAMVGGYFIKGEKEKNFFLKFWAVMCFVTHISIMWVTLIQNVKQGGNYGNAYDNILFPIYFCNFMMYLLLIVAFIPRKDTKFYRWIATFTAYGGVFGALITVFATPPDFTDFESVKSALSHTFLLMGCVYLFVGGYIKINVYNLVPYTAGLLSCGPLGGIIELIYFACGLPSPNAMYLVHGPNELPEFKWWMFVLCMLAIIFAFTVVWEFCTRKKEDRWYKTIRDLKLYFPEKWFNRNGAQNQE